MTIDLPIWAILLIATVVGWLVLLLWPSNNAPRGDYNFGGAVDAIVCGFGAIIVTLAVWLVYFAIV